MSIAIASVTVPRELDVVRTLFEEYAASLGIGLEWQNFAHELAELPGAYAQPHGCILLARVDDEPAGIVALKPLGDRACEMKRLYVRPRHRGRGLGQMLVERLIDDARALGYATLRLDTLPHLMGAAVALYERLGFVRTAPYGDASIDGLEYMQLML